MKWVRKYKKNTKKLDKNNNSDVSEYDVIYIVIAISGLILMNLDYLETMISSKKIISLIYMILSFFLGVFCFWFGLKRYEEGENFPWGSVYGWPYSIVLGIIFFIAFLIELFKLIEEFF